MSKSLFALSIQRIHECYNELDELTDRKLFESVQAHFASHPALPGEKVLKDNVNQLMEQLNSRHHEDGSSYDMFDGWDDWKDRGVSRDSVMQDFAATRIREASLGEDFRYIDANSLAHTPVDDAPNVYRIDAKLLKYGDTVRVLAKSDRPEYTLPSYAAGLYDDVGVLPEKFLKNNPMNADECSAEIVFMDHSNGNLKNLAGYVVVDTDKMSGDVVELYEEETDDRSSSVDKKEMSRYDTFMKILYSSKEYEFDDTVLTISSYYNGNSVKLDFENMTEEMYEYLDETDINVGYYDAMRILRGSKQYEFPMQDNPSVLVVSDYHIGDEVKLNLGMMSEEMFDEMSCGDDLYDGFEQAVGSIGTESGIDL